MDSATLELSLLQGYKQEQHCFLKFRQKAYLRFPTVGTIQIVGLLGKMTQQDSSVTGESFISKQQADKMQYLLDLLESMMAP